MDYPSLMTVSDSSPTIQPVTAAFTQAKKTLGLAIGIWILAGVVSLFIPLVADEMYYVEWSKRLDLGYFDHPPMVAYLIWLSGHHPRLAAWLISTCSLALLTKTSRDLGTRHWYYTPLLFVSTPLGLSAGLFMTPDIPLLLGWTLVIHGLLCKKHRANCFGIGVGLGIGLLSKPTALLMLPAIAIRFGWTQSLKICITALILCTPFLHWSATHQWLPFSFQGSRTFELDYDSLGSMLEAIGAQMLLVGPLLCWSIWQLLVKRRSQGELVIRWMCLPILCVGAAVSMGMHLEANWLMMLWVPMVIFAPKLAEDVPRIVKISQRAYGICTLLVLILLPITLNQLPAWIGPDRDGPALEQCLRQRFPTARILAVRYQEIALLSEASSPPYLLVTQTQRRSQYNLWQERVLTTATPGDVILNLEGQCPGNEMAYHRCAISAFECLPLSMQSF